MIENSIVRYLELEGFTNYNLPGAPLSGMTTIHRIPEEKSSFEESLTLWHIKMPIT